MSNGLFIVFEGIDGSGKSENCERAAAYLSEKTRKSVFLTREPSDGTAGKKIRRMLKTDHDPAANAEKYLQLYAKDRKDHLKREIVPALKRGETVVCDRYKLSTMAFQQVQGIAPEKIEKMHRGMPAPDLTIVLDLPAEKALERTERRGKKSEKFEKLEFMKAVRQNYLRLARKFAKENVVVVDAAGSRRAVFGRVGKQLDKLLASRKTA